MPVDVQSMDCDFLAFSGHKMCGPTGIGVLYGKYPLLKETYPLRNGGGNNARYNSCGVVSLKNPPEKFEAGTPNISGAIGLGAAVKYLMAVGMENIHQHELELRDYAIEKMSQVDQIEIYNKKCRRLYFQVLDRQFLPGVHLLRL
jgi:cysteine desulfurase/selenocysteine lyase